MCVSVVADIFFTGLKYFRCMSVCTVLRIAVCAGWRSGNDALSLRAKLVYICKTYKLLYRFFVNQGVLLVYSCYRTST